MKRTELYSKITLLNLQDEVKAKCGRNFTQVSNAELTAIILKAEAIKAGAIAPVGGVSKFERLIEVLQKKHILLPSEVKYIMA